MITTQPARTLLSGQSGANRTESGAAAGTAEVSLKGSADYATLRAAANPGIVGLLRSIVGRLRRVRM